MNEEWAARGVRYAFVTPRYFDQRGLRRYAGAVSLWALGVGAVVSGDFFLWNLGLGVGGFGGLLTATALMTVLFAGLCFSLAELSAAFPNAGGAYVYCRAAFGPWGGFAAGIGQNLAYVMAPAAIIVGVGEYLGELFGAPAAAAPVWWLVVYAAAIGLHVWGIEVVFRVMVALALIAFALLIFVCLAAVPHFDWEMLFNVTPVSGANDFFPMGALGICWSLPFAIWFFLGIETVPLAAEEADAPRSDVPKALILTFATLAVMAFTILFLTTAIEPGAAGVGQSEEPLVLALGTLFPSIADSTIPTLVPLVGLMASFHAILYACSRNIHALSRSGYLPQPLSVTTRKRKTPIVALVAAAAVGCAAAALIHYSNGAGVAGVCVNMAVFGILISYLMQAAAFLLLRWMRPEMTRPFRSPLGVPGASIAFILALATFVFLAFEPIFQSGLAGCALWYFVVLAYFIAYGRKNLVRASEESTPSPLRPPSGWKTLIARRPPKRRGRIPRRRTDSSKT